MPLHVAAWCCMMLHNIAWFCMPSHGSARIGMCQLWCQARQPRHVSDSRIITPTGALDQIFNINANTRRSPFITRVGSSRSMRILWQDTVFRVRLASAHQNHHAPRPLPRLHHDAIRGKCASLHRDKLGQIPSQKSCQYVRQPTTATAECAQILH